MRILFLALLFASCSSMKKTIIYSSLTGGFAGATTGALLSPNQESVGANMAIFAVVGAGLSALVGYALYRDDPRNYKLKNMLTDSPPKKNGLEIPLEGLTIDANLNKREAYRVPVRDLPERLRGKVGEQYLIKYKSRERYLRQGKKTWYIPQFEVYEYSYGEKADK